jgi:alpha-ketoglutarate-dependent taurine dioxygenase
MKFTTHENGWTIFCEGDLRYATQEDINQIAKYIASNTLVIVRDQHLTIEDELRIIKMFKDPESFVAPTDTEKKYLHAHVPNTDGMLCRVTGELNEHGMEGLAGFVDELVWHCNHPYRKERKPIVWLYGVKGTEGSRTTFNNNILSYNDLDTVSKEMVSGLEMFIKQGTRHDNTEGADGILVKDYTPKVVHTNNAGKTGLFFPFLQIERFNGMTREDSLKIIAPLAEFTTQEKYCYHHDWKDNDIILSEQWLGIHKRWKFEGMRTRLLHRAVFDFPDQDYKE